MKNAKGAKQIETKASRAAIDEPTPTSSASGAEERVRERAYHCWEEAGCPAGDGVEFWLKAEAELVGEERPHDQPGHN